MSPERPRNPAASVRQRLLNRARERREDFNYLLTRYANERLLFRLAESTHRDQFVLKGATLLELWHDAVHRATRDVYLLGFGEPAQTRNRFAGTGRKLRTWNAASKPRLAWVVQMVPTDRKGIGVRLS